MSNPATPDDRTQTPQAMESNGDSHASLAQLLEFLEIDDTSKQYARVLLALFTAHAADIVSDFYRKIQNSTIGSYVSDDAIERLKSKQTAHWQELFSSDFSIDYAQSMRRIGIRHRDIALSPSWYVAG